MNRRAAAILAAFLFTISLACPQNLKGGGEAYPNLRTNQKALEEWRALRFGMFIHWGPVSIKGTEIGWSRGKEVSFEEYDELYKRFNPVHFDAAEWVRSAKNAGMKYLVLVTKHHDGFSLWKSQATDYDIAATPFGRDIVWELADECASQGLLFGTYYSILDWHHPLYPIKFTGGVRKEGAADMERYIRFMKAQLRELIENCGTRILWFDGEWEDPWTHRMGMDLYAWIREQDDSLLINNRIDKGRDGMEGKSLSDRFAGDFETPEQQIGAYNPDTPWETNMTICRQWAWKPADDLKSLDECIRTLVRTAGGDGNLLLNVGPMPDGRIEPRQVERLREIGEWCGRYGETIYGTRGGPVPPGKWGVTTHKGNRVFVHILDASEPVIEIPELPGQVQAARLFDSGTSVRFEMADRSLRLSLPPADSRPVDLIVEISTNRAGQP